MNRVQSWRCSAQRSLTLSPRTMGENWNIYEGKRHFFLLSSHQRAACEECTSSSGHQHLKLLSITVYIVIMIIIVIIMTIIIIIMIIIMIMIIIIIIIMLLLLRSNMFLLHSINWILQTGLLSIKGHFLFLSHPVIHHQSLLQSRDSALLLVGSLIKAASC